jgi:hypothetical protein
MQILREEQWKPNRVAFADGCLPDFVPQSHNSNWTGRAFRRPTLPGRSKQEQDERTLRQNSNYNNVMPLSPSELPSSYPTVPISCMQPAIQCKRSVQSRLSSKTTVCNFERTVYSGVDRTGSYLCNDIQRDHYCPR